MQTSLKTDSLLCWQLCAKIDYQQMQFMRKSVCKHFLTGHISSYIESVLIKQYYTFRLTDWVPTSPMLSKHFLNLARTRCYIPTLTQVKTRLSLFNPSHGTLYLPLIGQYWSRELILTSHWSILITYPPSPRSSSARQRLEDPPASILLLHHHHLQVARVSRISASSTACPTSLCLSQAGTSSVCSLWSPSPTRWATGWRCWSR